MTDDDRTTDDLATDAQRKMVFALFRDAGIIDRDTRLRVTSEMLQRVVSSSCTLSRTDASAIIDALLVGDIPPISYADLF